MGIQSPCKDCPDRVMACHVKCERYAEYKKKKEEESKMIAQHFADDNISIGLERDRVTKRHRDNGWSLKRDER